MITPGPKSQSTLPQKGWILFDGQCGFCFRWVHLWEPVVAPRGFALKDLQSAFAEGSLQVDREHLLDDILVLTRDGSLKPGADAYLFVASQIWWAWPFYALFRLPGLHWLLWRGYRWFNRNRYRVSGHCPLPSIPSRSLNPRDPESGR